MKNQSEKFIDMINKNVFFKEFTFANNRVDTDNGEIEIADYMVFLGDITLIYQIKERDKNAKGNIESWFNRKVKRKAVDQIKNTLKYLNDSNINALENNKGHKVNIRNSDYKNASKIIIYDPGQEFTEKLRFEKYYESKSIGYINLFHEEDYYWICQYLSNPTEIKEYLDFREELYIKHKEFLIHTPEQYILGHFLKTSNTEKINIRYIDNLKEKDYRKDKIHTAIINHISDDRNFNSDSEEYYYIIKELALLNTKEFGFFEERFMKIFDQSIKGKSPDVLRFMSSRVDCTFVFISIQTIVKDCAREILTNITQKVKYELKTRKAIGVIACKLENSNDLQFYWAYIESEWAYNEGLEEELKHNYPLRKVRFL